VTDQNNYHGHMTMSDGSHVPLSEDEAAALWAAMKDAEAKRASDMPDITAALSVACGAIQRARDLGWREARYCPKDGAAIAIAELGSTGIWQGIYVGKWPDGHLMYADCATDVGGRLFKPLADLTDVEREKMERCDRDNQEYSDRIARSLCHPTTEAADA
jgi:hypothetical protein